jgi:hypothetical protein
MSQKDLSRWSGIACILAGILFALATLIHPARETPEIILKQEFRLVTAHWLYTFFFGFFMLGLTGLYTAQSERAGRFGLVSYLVLFFGALFFAVSNNYGLIAPVLAAHAPAMLDAINAYPAEVALNALLFVGFYLGLIFFGISILKARVFPRQIGILMAIGSPLNIVGSVLGLLLLEAFWIVAILGAFVLGLALIWAGHLLWSSKAAMAAL